MVFSSLSRGKTVILPLFISNNGKDPRLRAAWLTSIEEVIEIKLTDEEQTALKKSAAAVEELKDILADLDC